MVGYVTRSVTGAAACAALGAPGLALAAEGGGLPQLNTHTFPTQIFWALVFFALIYVLMSRVALPKIGAVLEERALKIDGDLDAARKMQADAEETTAKYEDALKGAREDARDALRAAADAASAEATKTESAFGAKLAEQALQAQERIEAARTAAMGEMKTVAADLAAAVVKKLADVDATPAKAKAAVDQVS